MKKVFLAIVFALPMVASAQFFTRTPNGFVSTEDPSKDYVIVEIEGTQAELFNKAKTAVTSMWNSPKDVMSYNEPEIITIKGLSSGKLSYTFLGMTSYYDFDYRLQLQFKDGRMRIDAPSAQSAVVTNGKGEIFFNSGGTTSMFKKNGKVRYEGMKKDLEDYFNDLFTLLISKMKNGVSNEDW